MLRTAQHWCTSSASAERVGQGEVGEGAVRMAAARMGHEGTWLALVGPVLTLTALTGLENTTLTLQGVDFWQGRLLGVFAKREL